MKTNKFEFDLQIYENLLKAVASMSRLYSDNNKAFIHPRFVEKLYAHASGAKDLSRRDMSFDALLAPNIGVGVKTFIAENISIGKSEKVAEFTRLASLGEFDGLDHEGKALKSAQLRNSRVSSDANEYSIDIDKSIYHCLVRTNGGAIIHEEPYQLIDTNNIKPTDSRGSEISKFQIDGTGHTYFSDGNSNYCYNKAKNVLYKKFELNHHKNSELIPLLILDDILEKILSWANLEQQHPKKILLPIVEESNTNQNFVVLPLYKTSTKEVQEKSGINQWNAGGRERKFGESYIPIPQIIHKKYPNFFPPSNQKFKIKLPNDKIISAKVCQQNNKALMSDPNTDLCDWLYKIIDLTDLAIQQRFLNKKPYKYDDLKKVGKDSVRVTKVENQDHQYEIESMDLDSYELFIADSYEEKLSYDDIETN
ncbi:MAG: hypothetical protein RIQ84_117 [Pseudomonadota bacterium]|jgi:hypothetical protein